MLTLYPPIKPYAEYNLPVESPHVLYLEESGNSNGIPVLFLHGGPGGGAGPDHRRYFDPNEYRIIIFDQRGAGRSTPHAALENNTTTALVSDIETIRHHLKIDRWVVFGGSWGSTLALVYAQTYPEQILGLIVRGIFLADKADVKWFFQRGGASEIFPDHFAEFINHIPKAEQKDLIKAYYQRLTSEDELIQLTAAKAWSQWEGSCLTLDPQQSVLKHFAEPHFATALARIECHYMINGCFLQSRQILKNMNRLKNIPGIIVHGRYDMVCPVRNAWQLHKRWSNSELIIVRDAGHAASEPGITHALIQATKKFANKFANSSSS